MNLYQIIKSKVDRVLNYEIKSPNLNFISPKLIIKINYICIIRKN
jgi:hypothetical protein